MRDESYYTKVFRLMVPEDSGKKRIDLLNLEIRREKNHLL